jgi:hypothetical protein
MIKSWGFAPGWYIIAPSALKPIEIIIWEHQGRDPFQPGAKPQESNGKNNKGLKARTILGFETTSPERS